MFFILIHFIIPARKFGPPYPLYPFVRVCRIRPGTTNHRGVMFMCLCGVVAAGERLMDLTSRDGDWFLEELSSISGNVNQFLNTLERNTTVSSAAMESAPHPAPFPMKFCPETSVIPILLIRSTSFCAICLTKESVPQWLSYEVECASVIVPPSRVCFCDCLTKVCASVVVSESRVCLCD